VSVLERHNVKVSGAGARPMVFAHGFGCDQNMWRYVAPAFGDDFKVILFDHIGAGGSDLRAYDPDRYARLQGYADDVVALAAALGLRDGVFVGHSVSAMIGLLANQAGASPVHRPGHGRPVSAVHQRCGGGLRGRLR
jgi:sigma-B regulation protein RsbQ